MLQFNNIHKSYGNLKALDNISFKIEEGEIFGLIGPDGAGKSTLFKIASTLLLPDSGDATILGYDLVRDYKELRKRIGYMPGNFSLYQDLSVIENLDFFAKVHRSKIEDNFDLIKEIYQLLEPFKNRKAGDLSGGMKQKLALSCALVHKPDILFLDEPTFGVDPVSRSEFWENLKKLKKTSKISTLVSTPYMDEAQLCDRVALINKGKILAVDSPQNICKNYPYQLFEFKSDQNYNAFKELKKIEQINSVFMFGRSLHLSVENGVDTSSLNQIISNKIDNFSLNKINANIEDVFMQLIKNN